MHTEHAKRWAGWGGALLLSASCGGGAAPPSELLAVREVPENARETPLGDHGRTGDRDNPACVPCRGVLICTDGQSSIQTLDLDRNAERFCEGRSTLCGGPLADPEGTYLLTASIQEGSVSLQGYVIVSDGGFAHTVAVKLLCTPGAATPRENPSSGQRDGGSSASGANASSGQRDGGS